jgi:hypothetical protein
MQYLIRQGIHLQNFLKRKCVWEGEDTGKGRGASSTLLRYVAPRETKGRQVTQDKSHLAMF